MLESRLSTSLWNALVTAHGAPNEYYEFVAYLGQNDAPFQEIYYTGKALNHPAFYDQNALPEWPAPNISAYPSTIPYAPEQTDSQGGSAMDPSFISR